MKVGIIIQARMTSTRLPGKVLKKVLDKPLLEYELDRLSRVSSAHKILVAMTDLDADKPIAELCLKMNIPFYCGSENDVLKRYYDAAREFEVDVVVRVTADCPLIDPEIVNQVVNYYLSANGKYDYVSNVLLRTFPRGMDCEVFSRAILEDVHRSAKASSDREHVTPYIYTHPKRFRLANVPCSVDKSAHRWTVDTEQDFILIKKIIETLYPVNPNFDMMSILHLLNARPNWVKINQDVNQKALSGDYI